MRSISSSVFLLSALLVLVTVSTHSVDQETKFQFGPTENEFNNDDVFELDEQDEEESPGKTQLQAFYGMIPKVDEPSGSQDLSNIQATVVGGIYVINFHSGMAVEVRYVTPNNGRPTMDLYDKHGNIMLHVNPRWDTRAFVLNTMINKKWGREERPTGFDFSAGVPITVRVEARQHHFAIVINGRIIHYYRHRLPVSTLKLIRFYWGGSGVAAKLISLSAYY